MRFTVYGFAQGRFSLHLASCVEFERLHCGLTSSFIVAWSCGPLLHSVVAVTLVTCRVCAYSHKVGVNPRVYIPVSKPAIAFVFINLASFPPLVCLSIVI